MARGQVVIVDEVGLHARPAARFVKLAGRFTSDIVVTRGDRRANAKSMIEVLTLEASQGDQVELEATGEDAEAAVEALLELLGGDASH